MGIFFSLAHLRSALQLAYLNQDCHVINLQIVLYIFEWLKNAVTQMNCVLLLTINTIRERSCVFVYTSAYY